MSTTGRHNKREKEGALYNRLLGTNHDHFKTRVKTGVVLTKGIRITIYGYVG